VKSQIKWWILTSYTPRSSGSTLSLRCNSSHQPDQGSNILWSFGSHNQRRLHIINCNGAHFRMSAHGSRQRIIRMHSTVEHRNSPPAESYHAMHMNLLHPHHWLFGSFTPEPQPSSTGPQLPKLVHSITRSAVAPYSGDRTKHAMRNATMTEERQPSKGAKPELEVDLPTCIAKGSGRQPAANPNPK
jgi:hypothetical protein